MVTRTQAIKAFLEQSEAPRDLVALYNEEMECQVYVDKKNNVALKDQEFRGKKYTAYEDVEDGTIYKPFRIPYEAMKESAHYNDPPMTFDLKKYAEGVGLTGWNWKQKKSIWVGYDFDSLVNHAKGLDPAELEKIKQAVVSLPYVTLRTSTTGSGYHVYVFVDPETCDSKTHTEHQSLARAVLNKMTLDCGYELQSKVDQLGQILWVWASKMTKEGLQLVKQGEVLKDIPLNWREHVGVVSKRITKIRPDLIDESELDSFNELAKKRMQTPLDDKHRAVIEALAEITEYETSWNQDYGMLTTHTLALKTVHKRLSLEGPFETASSGSSVKNCFAFPMEGGGWSVRRHGRGVVEANTWLQDSSGWTHCFFNRKPDFETACKINGGVEDTDQNYVFTNSVAAVLAAKQMGINLSLNPDSRLEHRQTKLKLHPRSNKLVVEINAEHNDPVIDGWIKKKTFHQFVSREAVDTKGEKEVESSEEEIRHCVTEEGCDDGWYIKGADGRWIQEPRTNVLSVLSSMGYTFKEREMEIGRLTTNYWTRISEPFQDEYPGNRRWNKDAAQLRYKRKEDSFDLHYPHWMLILDHLGKGLNDAVQGNEWCKANDIVSGAAYLKCWLASMIQHPKEPLPYLFFCGKENTGKTTFHEAIELLLTKGVIRISTALESSSHFNGEVQGAVLGIIEELNLSNKRSGPVINKIKDWVTSKKISIHPKGETPYMATNTLHFAQFSNDIDAAPVFPGDTRVVVIPVYPLQSEIPSMELFPRLEQEARDFTTELLTLEIPKTNSRLRIPVVTTDAKNKLADSNKTEIERFLEFEIYDCPGSAVSVNDLWQAYCVYTEPGNLTMNTFNKQVLLHKSLEKGKYGPGSTWHWANISLNPDEKPSIPFIVDNGRLKRVEPKD